MKSLVLSIALILVGALIYGVCQILVKRLTSCHLFETFEDREVVVTKMEPVRMIGNVLGLSVFCCGVLSSAASLYYMFFE